MENYSRVGGGETVEWSSEALQRNIGRFGEAVRELVDYKGSNQKIMLARSVCAACKELINSITVYEKSLYKQKHPFYFHKIHEWGEYSEVRSRFVRRMIANKIT